MNPTEELFGKIALRGDLLNKQFLEWLLLNTLSSNQEVVDCATNSLRSYAEIISKRSKTERDYGFEYLTALEEHAAHHEICLSNN